MFLEQQIMPGLCLPSGCPPPSRIECVTVDKVYDSCFQIEEVSDIFSLQLSLFPTGLATNGNVLPLHCEQSGTISCTVLEESPAAGLPGFSTLTLSIQIPIAIFNPAGSLLTTRDVFLVKTVTLCCPAGTVTDCGDSTVISCASAVTAANLSITISTALTVCLVIKCILHTQLLLPSYGFCVPSPCFTLGGICPPQPPEQCFTTTTSTTTSTSTTTTTSSSSSSTTSTSSTSSSSSSSSSSTTTTSCTSTCSSTTECCPICDCAATDSGTGTLEKANAYSLIIKDENDEVIFGTETP